MRISVLGPVAIDGEPGALGPRDRVVLAVLSVRAGSVVHVDELADALWGDDAPASAGKVVQGCIGRLRRSLGAAAIETASSGYRLMLDHGAIDAEVFERLLRHARQLMAAGRPERAADVLAEGLALWRGRPLVELEGWAPGCIEAARLGELRLEAEEDRVEAVLAAGRHREVVAEAQARAAEAPLREHRWVLLAQAEHRSGRQGDALRTVHHAREVAREQGLDPGPGLLAIEQQILRGDVGDAPRTTGPDAVDPASDGLPPMLRTASAMPFCGRESQADALWRGWESCRGGQFSVALVAGEPGVGKTRLVAEVAVDVLADGGSVLAGRCDEEVRVPFSPFVGALQWEVERSSPEDVGGRLGKYPGELVALLPEIADLLPGASPSAPAGADTERYRLFQSVCSWLAGRSARAPTVLVLEDLHWGDTGTVLLLRHLLRTRPPGLLVVGTYRDTDVVGAHPLTAALADLHGSSWVTRIVLGGLAPAAVRDLVERAGGPVSTHGSAFADRVCEETSGNPLFVGEVLRHLAESGLPVMPDGRLRGEVDLAAIGVSHGIREVIGRRVSRLHTATESLLRTAAVIGHEFDVGLLAAVLDEPEGDVLDLLEQAVTAALVTEVGVDQFRFAHALVRDTLHGELTASRRARAHRHVAQAVERRHGDDLDEVAAVLAVHWGEACAGGDPTAAAAWAERAGEHDLARRAPDEAARWFARALELCDDRLTEPGRRQQLLSRLAHAKSRALDHSAGTTANAAARLALEAGDVVTCAAQLCLPVRLHYGHGQAPDEDRIDLLEASLARLEDGAVHLRGQLLAGLASELTFTGDAARRDPIVGELRRLIDASDDPVDRWELMRRGTVGACRRWSDRAAMERVLRDCHAAEPHLPDGFDRVDVQEVLWEVNASVGDRDGCDRALAAIARETAEDRLSRHLAYFGVTAYLDGRLSDFQQIIDQRVEVMLSAQHPEAFLYWFVNNLELRRELGSVAELPALVAGWSDTPRQTIPSVASRISGAFLHFLAGDRQSLSLVGLDPEEISDDGGRGAMLPWVAEVAVAVGDDRLVEQVLDLVEPFHGMHLVTRACYWGSYDRLSALLGDRLGDHELVDAAFARAVHATESFRTPVWVARTELDWAESLSRRGLRDAAAVHVQAARAAIGDLPLTDSRNRADQLDARLA